MPAQGSLLLPSVEVVWGDYNLTSPTASKGSAQGSISPDLGPLVYDVRMSMEDQGQTPTGSMKWNPFGPAYAVYEDCLKRFVDYSIMMTFYYVGGRSITFQFYWGGQTETYGKEMEINVKLISLLDGLMNATFYAAIQADKEEKGKSHKDSVSELEKQFGIKGLGLIRYTNQAAKDTSQSIVKATYTDGSTFSDAVQNLVKDNGNNVFFNNIDSANAVVYTPYSHEERPTVEPIVLIPGGKGSPSPTKRYGYFIGPGIIQSFTRNYEWQPPQKSQEINAILARKAEIEKEGKKAAREERRRLRGGRNTSDKAQDKVRAESPSGSGVYQNKTSSNTISTGNENGPKKQDLFTKERAAKLSLTTLMCPSLVGIKPLDIIFIPAYSGSFIEDWIVTSVEYQQTQGGVDLAIQASRVLNDSSPMSDISSQAWQAYANELGLIPASKDVDSLRRWTYYAWLYNLGAPNIAPSSPSDLQNQSTPSLVSGEGAKSPSTVSNQEVDKGTFIKAVNNKWPANLSGLPPYITRIEGGQYVTSTNDPVFTAYINDQVTRGTYRPPGGSRILLKSNYLVLNLTSTDARNLYQTYTKGGRADYLNRVFDSGAGEELFRRLGL